MLFLTWSVLNFKIRNELGTTLDRFRQPASGSVSLFLLDLTSVSFCRLLVTSRPPPDETAISHATCCPRHYTFLRHKCCVHRLAAVNYIWQVVFFLLLPTHVRPSRLKFFHVGYLVHTHTHTHTYIYIYIKHVLGIISAGVLLLWPRMQMLMRWGGFHWRIL